MAGEIILRGDSLGDTPRAVLDVRGSVAGKIQSISSDTVLNDTHSTVRVDASGSAGVSVTLPAASGCRGRIYSLKLIDASNSLIIEGTGSDTVEGSANLTVWGLNDCVTIQSDGVSDWAIV